MKTSSYGITVSSVVGSALLSLIAELPLFAQSYAIRPTCSPNGQCRPNTVSFGYNDTSWRQWPLQPRPEETAPHTVGAHPIPTPPAIPEQALPHAESVPAKPPISGGENVLPALPGLGPGTTPPSNRTEGGATVRPNGTTPERPGQGVPGLPGIDLPPGFDLQPETKPKSGGSGTDSPGLPKTIMPGSLTPEPLAPTPAAPGPAAVPTPTPSKDLPAPKSPVFPPDSAPKPGVKPDEPSTGTPIKGSSVLRQRMDAVAVKEAAIQPDSPIRASWNAALAPEVVGNNNLRNASYEQGASDKHNPLRYALEGYCPVQLQEQERWVAGRGEFRTSYRGQVFRFSSAAAQQRFEAAPEKYAPVQNGNDVVLTVEENRTVAGSLNHSAVWHGRIYLFSSTSTLATFREDPSRYVNTSRPAANLRQPTDAL